VTICRLMASFPSARWDESIRATKCRQTRSMWPRLKSPPSRSHRAPCRGRSLVTRHSTTVPIRPRNTADDEPQVWDRYRPLNYPKTIETAGGVAAALLAGFSLTTVTQLVIGGQHPWLDQEAIGAFVVAAALYIYALQFTATALGFNATPSERIAYNPEVKDRPDLLHVIRLRQWEETQLRTIYNKRARFTYNTGMLALMLGLGLLIWPHYWHPWPWGRLVGIVVVGLAFTIEVLWINDRFRWLLPVQLSQSELLKHDPPFAPQMDRDGAQYLFEAD
jgi:hypothetical protein